MHKVVLNKVNMIDTLSDLLEYRCKKGSNLPLFSVIQNAKLFTKSAGEFKNDVQNLTNILISMNIKSLYAILPNPYDIIMLDFACSFANIMFMSSHVLEKQISIQNSYDKIKPDCVLINVKTVKLENKYNSTVITENFENFVKNSNKKITKCNNASKNLAQNKQRKIIMNTSGTTAMQKNVVILEKDIVNYSQTIYKSLKKNIKSENKTITILLPITHIFDKAILYAMFYGKYKVILLNFFASDAYLQFKMKKTDIIPVVPSILEPVYDFIKREHNNKSNEEIHKIVKKIFNISDSGFIVCGGSKLSDELIDFFRQIKFPVCQGYGSTELLGPISCCFPNENKYGSVGKLFYGIDYKFTKKQELLIKKEHVFLKYFDQKIQQKKENYYKTSDKAHIDKDGFLYILGRL
jgi:long-chain acyl-CoA synthetase